MRVLSPKSSERFSALWFVLVAQRSLSRSFFNHLCPTMHRDILHKRMVPRLQSRLRPPYPSLPTHFPLPHAELIVAHRTGVHLTSMSATAGSVKYRVIASLRRAMFGRYSGARTHRTFSLICGRFPGGTEKKGVEQSEGWRCRSEWRGVVIPCI